MAVVVSLIAHGQSLKVVSVIIGVISILVATAYTLIAYRLFVLLTTVSRGKSDCIKASTYDGIARFTLSVSAMYGVGHVCQSFMYLSSVFWHEFYAHNLYVFQAVFKWDDILTLLASLIYVQRSMNTIKRRNKEKHRQDEMRKVQQQEQHIADVPPPRVAVLADNDISSFNQSVVAMSIPAIDNETVCT